MADPVNSGGEPKSPRAEATRLAIQNAALRLFAERGFDDVGVREIGALAGADPALINRYFGGKDRLLAAAVLACVGDQTEGWGDRSTFPKRVASEAFGRPDGTNALQPLMIVARCAGSLRARRVLDRAFAPAVRASLARWIGRSDAAARAELIVALTTGVVATYDRQDEERLGARSLPSVEKRLVSLLTRLV